MKKNIEILFIALFCLAALGCSKNKDAEEKRNDVVLKAYRLIDEQRSDEAIELLERHLESDLNNYEYRVVLASAYAHKGGIKIQKLVPLVSQSNGFKDELTLSFWKINKDHSSNLKVNTVAINISRLLVSYAKIFSLYSAIPMIDGDQATFVKHAIYLLNEAGVALAPEDALYRAILGVVLFKHRFAEGLVGEFVEPADEMQECRFDLGKINDALVELGKILINIFSDIAYADPSQEDSMESMGNSVAEGVSSLTIETTSLIVLDEASSLFLQQTIIQNGFGKLIKCGGD